MFEELYKETFQQVTASPHTLQEVLKMKDNPKKTHFPRLLLVAALLIFTLATTVFAYSSLTRHQNPIEFLDAFFGDTNYVSNEGRTYVDQYGQTTVEPEFRKEALKEEAAAKYVAPYIYGVGQSITHAGDTLTVDAIAYDPTTQCGIVYVQLENPNGFSDYFIQPNGELGWSDRVKIVASTGITFFLDEARSSETCFALAGYFYMDDSQKDTVLSLQTLSRHLVYSKELKISLEDLTPMEHITLGDGGVQISPIALVIHGNKLGLMTKNQETMVDSVTIRYIDGSEYPVSGSGENAPLHNYAHGYKEPGDGYETDRRCVTYLLNRIVPLDDVSEIIVNGISYTVD